MSECTSSLDVPVFGDRKSGIPALVLTPTAADELAEARRFLHERTCTIL